MVDLIGIHGDAHFFEIVCTEHGVGRIARHAKRRHQKRHEHGNRADDDKQFDERKRPSGLIRSLIIPLGAHEMILAIEYGAITIPQMRRIFHENSGISFEILYFPVEAAATVK
ncbi:MAG TPA: hypothetical protein VFE47_21670 [Tepidisphaeraceae bacterium]|nr:hypothetical protein [Tepidisphaeraceae bacterium]